MRVAIVIITRQILTVILIVYNLLDSFLNNLCVDSISGLLRQSLRCLLSSAALDNSDSDISKCNVYVWACCVF